MADCLQQVVDSTQCIVKTICRNKKDRQAFVRNIRQTTFSAWNKNLRSTESSHGKATTHLSEILQGDQFRKRVSEF